MLAKMCDVICGQCFFFFFFFFLRTFIRKCHSKLLTCSQDNKQF